MTKVVGAASARRPRLPAPYVLLIPSTLFMAALLGWPMVKALILAFTGDSGHVTLANWTAMAGEPHFWESVRNTLLLIIVLIPLQFALALTMALMVRAKPRLRSFHFYIWSVPLAVSDLATGLVWLTIFQDNGYLNSLLHLVGLGGGYSWLSYQHPVSLFVAVAVAELWRATSLVFIILVAGLGVIPQEYDEAAAIFGATFWQRLRHVTLPLLRPSLQVALILRTILAFQAFAVAVALAGREFPLMIGETYQWYATLQDPNVASASAIVVLLVSMVPSVIYMRALRTPHAVRKG
jgi:multiple sugar transport system permease protein